MTSTNNNRNGNKIKRRKIKLVIILLFSLFNHSRRTNNNKLIAKFFAINVAILNTIVIYFVASPKIENLIERRLLLKICPR